MNITVTVTLKRRSRGLEMCLLAKVCHPVSWQGNKPEFKIIEHRPSILLSLPPDHTSKMRDRRINSCRKQGDLPSVKPGRSERLKQNKVFNQSLKKRDWKPL